MRGKLKVEETYLDCLAEYGVSGAHPGSLALTKDILSHEKMNSRSKILDAGCGTGQTAAYLYNEYKADVTALDLHPIMIEKAKKRLTGLPIHVLQGNVECLNLEPDSFDIVLSESVLAFTELRKSLKSIKRVLKKDGLLLAIEMVLEEQLSPVECEELKIFYGLPQLLEEDEWIAALKKFGLRDVRASTWQLKQESEALTFEDTPEFILSENISEKNMTLLETHFKLKEAYENVLGFRLFRCKR